MYEHTFMENKYQQSLQKLVVVTEKGPDSEMHISFKITNKTVTI